jgi:cytoskeletal protein CcmA (bactofilin family)
LSGLLRIDGDFTGSIKTEGKVLIGKSGRAEAVVHAGTVVIGGVLKGNINASEKVVILSTGMLIGNVTSPRLLVEDGVIINGYCGITDDGKGGEAPSEDRRKVRIPYSENKRKLETASSWKK